MTEVTYDEMMTGSSSAFDSAFYNAEDQRVYINFWNGTVISYSGFSKADWDRFNGAMSKGTFYNTQMKSGWRYPASYVDGEVKFVGRSVKTEPENVELNHSVEPSVNITVNVFFSGDPNEIAKAVERLAPSIRAINKIGKV